MIRDHFRDDRKVDRRVDLKPFAPRRIEVITGTETRRRWSEETKATIVAESFAVGAVVAQAARRHGLRPQQLFYWRRQLRAQWQPVAPAVETPAFVPAIVEDAVANPPPAIAASPPVIEIEAGMFVVRLRGPVDGKALASVLRAVKAVS